MSKTVYIHYGMSEFDKSIFKPIKNGKLKCKPYGGLWASPVDSKWGWKEWCTSENFHVDQLDSSFSFILSDGARVLHLRSGEDVDKLPRYCPFPQMLDGTMRWIDFEKIAKIYDAVEVHLSEERDHIVYYNRLYFKMYGWDCDSIIIMNPDIVVPKVSDKRKKEIKEFADALGGIGLIVAREIKSFIKTEEEQEYLEEELDKVLESLPDPFAKEESK